MENKIDVSIIIVSWNVSSILDQCLSSIKRSINCSSREIIVIDNASADDTVDMLSTKHKDVILLRNNSNVGFAKACNQGINVSNGRFMLLLNPDTVLKNDFKEILMFMEERNDCGIVGCQLVYENGQRAISFQNFPTILRIFTFYTGIAAVLKISLVNNLIRPLYYLVPKQSGHKRHINSTEEVDSIVGAFFLFQKAIINKIGNFDENYFVYFEETDFCFRAKQAGYKNYVYPHYSVMHYEGKSTEKTNYKYLIYYTNSLKYFFKKNYPRHYYMLALVVLKISILFRVLVLVPCILFNKDVFERIKVYLEMFKL
ncbi:MAG: glycosyltransferase family 2 protein [Candidatus Omnitrophica bacterium]|nr:glycosyltransferase family 2 protein [Candidatus Omnitrophota bacterium]